MRMWNTANATKPAIMREPTIAVAMMMGTVSDCVAWDIRRRGVSNQMVRVPWLSGGERMKCERRTFVSQSGSGTGTGAGGGGSGGGGGATTVTPTSTPAERAPARPAALSAERREPSAAAAARAAPMAAACAPVSVDTISASLTAATVPAACLSARLAGGGGRGAGKAISAGGCGGASTASCSGKPKVIAPSPTPSTLERARTVW